MNGWTIVLNYVQTLVWPAIVVFAALLFRDAIARLIDRIKKVNTPAGGVEFETDKQSQQLADSSQLALVKDILATSASRTVVRVPDAFDETEKNQGADVAVLGQGGDKTDIDPLGWPYVTGGMRLNRLATLDPQLAVRSAWLRLEHEADASLRAKDIDEATPDSGDLAPQLRQLGLSEDFLKVADGLQDLHSKVADQGEPVSTTGALNFINSADNLLYAVRATNSSAPLAQ